jgi:FAD/FMN-containing dehydrogenase
MNSSDSKLNRREILAAAGTGGLALVAGFDPVERRWIQQVEAASCPAFVDVPRLDGQLLLDTASRAAVATDKGNIIHETPCAVLRPGSVEDIREMVRYCRRYNIKVAARGQGHTMFGQSLSGGLVIDNQSLNTIHSIGPDGADVDAGVKWKDLIIAAFAQGLTPPVITGYTGLSISGTLSVGGISGRFNSGAQVDHVRELEVVTGEGEIKRCSMNQRRGLFEAVLAGLGQCAIITRVKMDLIPAKPMARLYNLEYVQNSTFFRDLRTLINRGELNECYNIWLPAPSGTGFIYQIQAVIYFDPAQPPDTAHLFRDLSLAAGTLPFRDMSYLEWELNVDVLIDFFRAVMSWDSLIKPWFDVWLPERYVESYAGEVLPTLTPADVGPLGFLLLFPLRRSKFTRPFFLVPEANGGDWVYLFDILTVSAAPGPDPGFVSDMLARNRRLFEKARAMGGTRYPIGAIQFSRNDWQRQYGDRWREFVQAKREYDPDNILTPGPGIFS